MLFRSNLYVHKGFLDIGEAARDLGVSVTTVRRLIKRQQLKAVKLGGTWRLPCKDLPT
jgi:excisionase family DNA binding protein